MDKESAHLLQCLDSNCNNCIHMVRDVEKFKLWQKQNLKWQVDYFTTMRNKLIEKANMHKEKGKLDVYKMLMKEAHDMKFQFSQSATEINYGFCMERKKHVSFIPNTIQVDTQDCFKHRKCI